MNQKIVTFYIQVSESVGIGHLTRSSHLITALQNKGVKVLVKLSADNFGIHEAHLRSLHSDKGWRVNKSVVVIDGVYINETDSIYLLSFNRRILISPVFNRFDIATHVMVRGLSNEVRKSLSSNVTLNEDFSFSFVTSKGLNKKNLSFNELIIGLCFSGSKNDIDINFLLKNLEKLNNLQEVRLIDRRMPHLSIGDYSFKIHKIMHTDNPWGFMSDINVFIGAEGVMISESVAQGIPTISLASNKNKYKNEKLKKSGALKLVSRKPLDQNRLLSILSDNINLKNMHTSALKSINSNMPDRLANEVFSIIK